MAQLKNDLVATVSHELKTPLASIRLLVDTLLERDEAGGAQVDVREYLQMISQENSRLTRLIDSFLTFSRLERGKQRFEFRLLDAREVVRAAADVFRERGETGPLRVVADEPAWVRGDLDALVTAVVNLLENARKYSDPAGEILLTAAQVGEEVTLAVRDQGIGLTPRAASQVFERFYQVDQRVARTQGGCGLGLSIVEGIVQAHGGDIRVASQPGVGSTFTVVLPAQPAPPQSVATTAALDGEVAR